MNALNKRLMEIVSGHLSKDPSCNLAPVFDDYRAYVGDISAKVGDRAGSQPSTSVVPPAASQSLVSTGKMYKYVCNFIYKISNLCVCGI